ncbi:Gfo/Idh/MocA family protein [Mangrovibacillus cuniculi]|uniref:Gfo/Idh/MocA family oxidoreductase n=1 Tax=Mangrovibacillus cuniculi TaxID=2593652 RepID=A0A7S8C906_9BACI|nr:Gfo/Idh/MocA family oxidoreductase [Mangrovibacillus cuniculi]QPC45632.1 Gfo/Idh/MocA family oxidoreductase [Mangrovibacillus cuniculi]
MVKLALLSAWHVHTGGFVTEALKHGAELSVVWDDDVTRGKAFADSFATSFNPNLEDVLADPTIDAVMVECATVKHKEVIIKAAKAKKHIFTDKALALSVEDCVEIQEAMEENGVHFIISLESLEIGPYRYAKHLIDDGKLGEITSVYFRRAHQAALDKNMLPSYWFDKSQTGGGVTLDLGCHGLYLLPHFLGKPQKVSCLMNELKGTGSDEISTTVVEFESGAIGTAHTSFVSGKMDNLLEIVGTEGSLIVNGTKPENFRAFLQSFHVEGFEQLSPVPKEAFLLEEKKPIVEFIQAIQRSDFTPSRYYNIEAATGLTRMIECAYESSKSGKVVHY